MNIEIRQNVENQLKLVLLNPSLCLLNSLGDPFLTNNGFSTMRFQESFKYLSESFRLTMDEVITFSRAIADPTFFFTAYAESKPTSFYKNMTRIICIRASNRMKKTKNLQLIIFYTMDSVSSIQRESMNWFETPETQLVVWRFQNISFATILIKIKIKI